LDENKMKTKKYNKYLAIGISVILIIAVAYFLIQTNKSENIVTVSIDDSGIKIAKDGTKYLVDPSKIRGGGPGKGGIGVDKGIPALADKNIKFVSVAEADEWIEDNELVLVLEYKGVKRVYPHQILVWHEIANDNIAGDPILITYCPLCGTGIAYERTVEINGQRIETRFGVSGKLFNSNLIMYEEETDTYWQQIEGLAIVGELTGQKLVPISIDTIVWRDWKKSKESEDSEILSQKTGINRNYGRDPYGNYYEDSFLIFPVENSDNRIFAKDLVFGIEIDGVYKAYREIDVKKAGVIEDVVNGVNIRVERLDDGRIVVTNIDTGEEIVKEVGFWFSWYAFHPDTELYEN